jgi:hypothetical protein
VTGGENPRGAVALQASYGAQPGLQPPVICLNRVVRILLHGVQGRGDQLIEHPRVDGRTVGRDLDRDRGRPQRPGEEAPRRCQVTPGRQQDVDDLAVLIDRPVQIGPLTGDHHVGLIGEPPVARGVTAWLCRLDELRGEPLHLPVDGDVVNGDAALGHQLLDVPVGQAIAQVPATASEITSRGNRKPAKTEVVPRAVTGPVSSHPRSPNATVPRHHPRRTRLPGWAAALDARAARRDRQVSRRRSPLFSRHGVKLWCHSSITSRLTPRATGMRGCAARTIR